MKKWRLFVDLDGVLVDLVLPLMDMWDAKINSEDEFPEGFHWDVQGATNFVRQNRGMLPILQSHRFWNMSKGWWLNLYPYPTAVHFMHWLEPGPFDICLATAAVNSEAAAAKVDWIHRWLPEYDKKSLIGYPKYMLAGPDAILIDDSDKNCEEFAAAGGKAILVPRPWNKGYNLPTSFNAYGERRPVYNVVAAELYAHCGAP